ncbi:MAG: hypothetical protein LUQ47_06150 [Methanotrichaceae archaeon]|nr:hypothetical protein [Methanotrichaceae archaeon]
MKGTGVTVNCLHPGVTKTKLLRAGFGDYPGADPKKGAETPIYLASAPEVENLSGLYFENLTPTDSSPRSHDPALQKAFWQIAEDYWISR